MATITVATINQLSQRIRDKSKIANQALSLAINKSATFLIRESINQITSEVALKPSYVNRNINTVARASANNLRAIVQANTRNTLLGRYPHVRTKEGIKVRINATGGFREIKGARIIRSLAGSGVPAIGVRNTDFARILRQAGGRSTPAKSRKIQRALSRARRKPYGMTPLSSRSINQLFTSVRVDIQPELRQFIVSEFIADFRRLSR